MQTWGEQSAERRGEEAAKSVECKESGTSAAALCGPTRPQVAQSDSESEISHTHRA